jgi:hypothetical protein
MRYLERLRVDHQNSLVSWGGFPGINPLDFEKLTPQARIVLYATGSLRADEVYPTDLFDYLTRYSTSKYMALDEGDFRAAEGVPSILRRKLQRGIADVRKRTAG